MGEEVKTATATSRTLVLVQGGRHVTYLATPLSPVKLQQPTANTPASIHLGKIFSKNCLATSRILASSPRRLVNWRSFCTIWLERFFLRMTKAVNKRLYTADM